jgi:putative oxidoreductase
MNVVLPTFAAPLGRLLLSAIFVMSGIHKLMNWESTAEQMQAEGIVAVPVMLAIAAAVEVGAGLSVLTGCWARLGALALVVFLIPTSLIFHDFWQYTGMEQQNQMAHFMKNMAILGGLLMVVALGPGPLSFDARRRTR